MLLLKIKKLSQHLDKNWNCKKNDYSILISYGEQSRRTTVIWNNDNPTWNETFLFNYDKNISKFIIKLIDEDVYGKSEVLKEKEIEVYNKSIKTFENDFIEYEMGNIYYNKNNKIKKLKSEVEKLNIKIDNINLIVNY